MAFDARPHRPQVVPSSRCCPGHLYDEVAGKHYRATDDDAGFEVGGTYPIHYDPAEPSRSATRVGIRWQTVFLTVGEVVVLAGVISRLRAARNP
jgi:hypothetical protein